MNPLARHHSQHNEADCRRRGSIQASIRILPAGVHGLLVLLDRIRIHLVGFGASISLLHDERAHRCSRLSYYCRWTSPHPNSQFPEFWSPVYGCEFGQFITLERDGPVKLGDVGEGEKSVGYMQYPAGPSSPERTEVYPLVASIIASLHVVQSFTILALISLVSSWAETKLTRTKTRLRHRRSGLLVVAGSLILSWAAQLVLLIKIATCATHGRLNLFFLTFYVHWLLVLCAAYCPLIGFCIIFIIKAATEKILRIYHHPAPLQKIHQHWANWTRSARAICDGDNPAKMLDALKDYLKLTLLFFPTLAGMVIFGAFLYFFYSRLLLFPPAGSSLMELDQAAALAGGLFNFGLTLHSVSRQV